MKKIILIILIFTTYYVSGQNHYIGAFGGVNLTNINESHFIMGHHNRLGFNAGLTYEYFFKNRISIDAEICYTLRGFTKEIIYTSDTGKPIGDKNNIQYNYDYISLPIKSGYTLGKKVFGFAKLGIIPAILINANTIFPLDQSSKLLNSDIDISDYVTRFDLAGMAELGGGYQFKESFCLFIAISYQNSFTTITNPDYFSDGKAYHYGMSFNLGLKCALKKKG
jgi:hypothetical protein